MTGKMDAWSARDIVVAVLLTAGLLATLYLLVKATNYIFIYLRPYQLYRYRRTTAGEGAWALVTGSTAGIGEAYAYELAYQGFNVVLRGRNPAKLLKVREKLARAFPNCSFKTVVADTCRCTTDKRSMDEPISETQDLKLTVLINNALG